MSKRNDLLGTFAFLAMVIVVMCHVDDAMSPSVLPVRILGGSFSDANVYNFFWLSGYFLGRHFEEKHWWRAALFKRVSTLLVPYVMWSVIYFVIRVLMGAPDSDYPIGFEGVNKVFGVLLGAQPACPPMWYLKTLYLFVFAAPVFGWWLMKFRSTFARVVLMGVVVAFYVAAKYFGFWGMSFFCSGGFMLLGFVFFCAGLWLSQIKMKSCWLEGIQAHKGLVVVSSLSVWTLSAVWSHFHGWWFEMNILISSVCLFLIACVIRKVPGVWVRNAFIVYGAHLILLGYYKWGHCRVFDSVAQCLAEWGEGWLGVVASMGVYALLLVGVVGLAIVGGEIMRRVVPTFYAALVGGRVE